MPPLLGGGSHRRFQISKEEKESEKKRGCVHDDGIARGPI